MQDAYEAHSCGIELVDGDVANLLGDRKKTTTGQVSFALFA